MINNPDFRRLHRITQLAPSILGFQMEIGPIQLEMEDKVYCLSSSMSIPSQSYNYKIRPIPFLTFHNRSFSRLVGFSNQIACIGNSILHEFIIYDLFTHHSFTLPHIHPTFSEEEKHVITWYGIGYDPPSDDHKVIVISIKKRVHSVGFVYSVKNSCWKSIGIGPYGVRKDSAKAAALLLKGALHWIMYQNNDKKKVIWGVDVLTYKWFEIDLPEQTHGVLFGLERQGEMCVCCVGVEYMCRVWVMKEYGDVNSWTLLVSILSNKIYN